jgi:hypothetical protein
MTKDDLEQIDQLLERRLKAELSNFGKTEIDPLHERLDAQRDQTASVEKNLSAQISLEANDLADIIRDGIFPKLDKHDEQIVELQEEVGIKTRANINQPLSTFHPPPFAKLAFSNAF